jgi:hypothetical protein
MKSWQTIFGLTTLSTLYCHIPIPFILLVLVPFECKFLIIPNSNLFSLCISFKQIFPVLYLKTDFLCYCLKLIFLCFSLKPIFRVLQLHKWFSLCFSSPLSWFSLCFNSTTDFHCAFLHLQADFHCASTPQLIFIVLCFTSNLIFTVLQLHNWF